MAKSLFDIEEPKKNEIPVLLPTMEDDESNIPYREQEVIVDPLPEKEIEQPMKMTGAFFTNGEDLVTDIRLEFDVNHSLFKLYIKRLHEFVKECEDVHVLKSSSGI